MMKKNCCMLMVIGVLLTSGCGKFGQYIEGVRNIMSGHERQQEEILKALEEKYGEEFEVMGIGGQWGSMNPNTVKAMCYPTKNKYLTFMVEMNVNTHIVYDKYLARSVAENEKQEIKSVAEEIWGECQIETSIDTVMSYPKETNLDMRFSEYTKLYPGNWLLVDIFVGSEKTPDIEMEVEKIQQCLKGLQEKKYTNVTFCVLYLKSEGYEEFETLQPESIPFYSYYIDEEEEQVYAYVRNKILKDGTMKKGKEALIENFNYWLGEKKHE